MTDGDFECSLLDTECHGKCIHMVANPLGASSRYLNASGNWKTLYKHVDNKSSGCTAGADIPMV